MLNRQRLVLGLIAANQDRLDKTLLFKLAFLLRQEYFEEVTSSFYDFLPYRYGPYSFGLQQELESLAEIGWIKKENYGYTISKRVKKEDVECLASEPVIKKITDRFKCKNKSEIIDYIYDVYKKYTVKSHIKKNAEERVAEIAVYTAGYEGLQVDGFLNLLVKEGIKQIIDVRKNPIARRYGFHRSTLQRLSSRVDIGYQHIPGLGIPSSFRKDLNDYEDYKALFQIYEKEILPNNEPSIQKSMEALLQKPSVLVCMESDHLCCHRSILAQIVSKRLSLPIIHLRASHGSSFF